jgi:hypothetical protein
VPAFDGQIQKFTSAVETTIRDRIPNVLMWVGIAFGGLVGIMLLFVLAYCFITCVATKPYDKRIKSPYAVRSRRKSGDEDDEEIADDAVTVGARAVRRVRSGATHAAGEYQPHETRVKIHL